MDTPYTRIAELERMISNLQGDLRHYHAFFSAVSPGYYVASEDGELSERFDSWNEASKYADGLAKDGLESWIIRAADHYKADEKAREAAEVWL